MDRNLELSGLVPAPSWRRPVAASRSSSTVFGAIKGTYPTSLVPALARALSKPLTYNRNRACHFLWGSAKQPCLRQIRKLLNEKRLWLSGRTTGVLASSRDVHGTAPGHTTPTLSVVVDHVWSCLLVARCTYGRSISFARRSFCMQASSWHVINQGARRLQLQL